MIGIGAVELAILGLVCLLMIGLPLVLLLVLLPVVRRSSPPAAAPHRPAPAPSPSPQEVLRSRFFVAPTSGPTRECPRCGAPLPADAPEGLCPACLLAGGISDEALTPTTSGHDSGPHANAIRAEDLAAAFPQLEILELLGQGGMGTVFKVRQKNLDRLAALKVIPPQAALDPTFAERFAREARALARLNHAHIVTVYDFGQAGSFYFLLMEFVDGCSLRQLMQTERIAPREALAIVPQVCDALQYAHDQGIVHRDIKPENVLIDRSGRVKIADFGLAKLLRTTPADFTLTQTQQVMGTPRYMAPEQIERPLAVDHRADIYSLGVVLYEMLTGELPIGRFAPPSQKVQVDVRLDEIVLRALEKEPERRYQRVSEVKTELESVVTLPASGPAPASWPAQPNVREAEAVQRAVAVARAAQSPPLGIVLAVAIGMVLGMLMMGAGVALAAVPLFGPWDIDVWPFLGAGAGVLLGGAGAFFGSYNAYRQLAGAVDLMNCREITWFDYVLLAFAAVGVLILLPGLSGLLTNSAEEHVYPMLVIGGVIAFQGMMGMLWRWGARQKAIAAPGDKLCSPTQQARQPVRPGFLLAAVVPSLAIAGVWSLVLADMHFLTSHWPQKSDHVMEMTQSTQPWKSDGPEGIQVRPGERIVVPMRGDHRGAAIRSLWIAACHSVTMVLLGLALWRKIGPRRTSGGFPPELTVAPPFGHPVWPLIVAVVSFTTLVLPWVRLHLDDVAADPAFKIQLTPGTNYYGDTVRFITGMPQGERYVAPGYKNTGGAAAAILCVAGAVLAAGTSLGRPLTMRVQGGLAIAAGVIAVVILLAMANQLGERDETLIHDAITQRNLARTISGFDVGPGGGPALVLQEYVNVSPAVGLYLAAGMSGLLILIGATQWAWHVGAPQTEGVTSARPAAVMMPVKLPPADDRESIRQQVRGPGAGLIVSGVAGLMLPVLMCTAIPLSWAIALPVPEYGAVTQAAAPVASIGTPHPPIILAQTGQMGSPTWVGMLGIIVVAAIGLLTVPSSLLLILGGMKMRQLRSYGLAVLAAIAALLPLGPQWLISLPMGIWALAVLARADVKAAFE
jgi:predicted Ser/Thr protein kinase